MIADESLVACAPRDRRGQQHGRTRTKERQQLITDFPDSNRFHRLLLFDYASALNEPGRCFWYGTPVGIRREELPDVVLKNHIVRARGAPSRERSRSRSVASVPSVKSVSKPLSLFSPRPSVPCPRLSAITLYRQRRDFGHSEAPCGSTPPRRGLRGSPIPRARPRAEYRRQRIHPGSSFGVSRRSIPAHRHRALPSQGREASGYRRDR